MVHRPEAMSQERLNHYVEEAAKAAGYPEGFGIKGCDLNKSGWSANYNRQSLEEQAQNNRLPDYLRTSAQEAKKIGALVPLEYVLHAVTGEHLERPKMIFLRRLMAERRIAGVIFPALDRLSREPMHQQIFELQATHYGIRLHYADAPNGNDPGSQFARSILTHAAKLVKLSNHKNARGGNIGRTIMGLVPAHKARAATGTGVKAKSILVAGCMSSVPGGSLMTWPLMGRRRTKAPPGWWRRYFAGSMGKGARFTG